MNVRYLLEFYFATIVQVKIKVNVLFYLANV